MNKQKCVSIDVLKVFCNIVVINIYTDMVFMYDAAPGVGKGHLKRKANKKTSTFSIIKMYTVIDNV
jgi:hypothetical protein